ncbi:hypothetical protein [Maricaulis salignorans]|uniref:Uncharacterized protein n=1 Tax=Maricaulis salignorans TaxID=144026 RepID=A0A1G9RPQ0_9PROT|nr:hypothetical protein [Maricaulis salignorans]SDM25183.1 hypothetical protein SAMN04488568_107105 [Maricaulis salignorans]
MRHESEIAGLGKLSRRAALLSGGAALASCATPGTDDCNPANAGIGRYLRCRQQYVDRQQNLASQARQAEGRNAQSHARIDQLQAENRRLRRRLASLNREIDALDSRRSALLRRAASLPALSNAQNAYLHAVRQYLDDILALQDEGLSIDPPLDLLPADAPERREFVEARRELRAARTETREVRDVIVELAAGELAGRAVERRINAFLRRVVGAARFARFVHPVTRVISLGVSIFGAAATIFRSP